jgi:uncharacterized protein (UPF0548 family)
VNDLTYAEVGGTRTDSMPAGYRHVRRHAIIGQGAAVFAAVRAGMLGFEIHRGAGLRVRASGPPAVGVTFDTGIGFGPVRIWAPCRVVWYSDDDDDEFGYGFGTLPGHPARGEEAFALTRHRDDVHFTVRAFSRPATWYMRLGGPIATLMQDRASDRYLASARGLARRSTA